MHHLAVVADRDARQVHLPAAAEQEGSFYTSNWDVKIPGDFDVAAFIGSLPAAVGEGWTVRKSSIPVSYATVELVKAAEGVSVTVDDTSIPGAVGNARI